MKYHALYGLLLIVFIAYCKTPNQPNRYQSLRFNDPIITHIIAHAWENVHAQRYDCATVDFIRLIQKNYIDDDILFGAGLSHFYIGETQKAIEYFTRTLDINPYHFDAYYFRAQSFLRQHNTYNARKDLKAILSLHLHKGFICGYYRSNIADSTALHQRKEEALKILSKISYD